MAVTVKMTRGATRKPDDCKCDGGLAGASRHAGRRERRCVVRGLARRARAAPYRDDGADDASEN